MPTLPVGCAVNLASLIPSCAALTSVAGVRDFFYAARNKDLTFTRATDGTITGVSLATGAKLIKISGRKFQNSGAVEVAKSSTGKTRYKHTFNARVYHRTQAERNSIEQLGTVEDLTVIAPNNDNQIEVYGQTIGLAPTSGKGGTGIKLDDDNTFLFAFEGDEPKLPVLFNSVTTPTTEDADYATNIALLDGLVNA